MPVEKKFFLVRDTGPTSTFFTIKEFLYITIHDDASQKQKSLAYKMLTICYLAGWKVFLEDVKICGLEPFIRLYISHHDVMGEKSCRVYWKENEEPQFPCAVLGLDARETELEKARNA